jgi:hypothetical protein
MGHESLIWHVLSGWRIGRVLACVLIPGVGIFLVTCRRDFQPPLSLLQQLGYASLGGLLGAFAYLTLTARDGFLKAVATRRARGQSAALLQAVKWGLYLVALPILLIVLLAVLAVLLPLR